MYNIDIKRKRNIKMNEKIELEQLTIQLNTKTNLGFKGWVDFSDGCRLVVSHETDGFGENLCYFARLEKKTEKDGIISYEVYQNIFCIDLTHVKRVCQQVFDKKKSEGIKIV